MTKDEFLKRVVLGEVENFPSVGCWPHLRASYLELVNLFGEPTLEGDGMESDCGWEFTFDGIAYNLYNKEDGVAAMGYEGTPTKFLDEWHVWSSESDPHRRKEGADKLREALKDLCPMEKYPSTEYIDYEQAQADLINLSPRGLEQVWQLIGYWEGDIFPDKRTDAEIMAEDKQE